MEYSSAYEAVFVTPTVGSVFHPSNFRYSRNHPIYMINHAKDKVMFVDEDLIPKLENVRDGLNTIKPYIVRVYDFSVDMLETSLVVLS